MKRILDYDPLSGMTTYHSFDANTGKSTIEYAQDQQAGVDRSKDLASALNKKEEWWPVGHITDLMALKWAKECGHKPYTKEWNEYAIKQLNSRDYAKLNPNRIKL
jgi:hypothetical protein